MPDREKAKEWPPDDVWVGGWLPWVEGRCIPERRMRFKDGKWIHESRYPAPEPDDDNDNLTHICVENALDCVGSDEMDREKVKKGLQAHAEGCGHRSNYCDFMECPYRIGDESCDIEQMCIDALALLKEHEAVEPKKTAYQRVDHTIAYRYRCGMCDMSIFPSYKYCPFCGQAVKWE